MDGVAAVELPAGTAATEACPALPAKLRPVRFEDGLWLGITSAELRKSFGLPVRPHGAFATEYHGQEGSLDVMGSIALELRGARVVALHVAHASQD